MKVLDLIEWIVMRESDFRKLLSQASPSTKRINVGIEDTLRSEKPELLAGKTVEEVSGSESVGTLHLTRIHVSFRNRSGKGFDRDNRKYVFKTGQDALEQLGFTLNDKDIECTAEQRLDDLETGVR